MMVSNALLLLACGAAAAARGVEVATSQGVLVGTATGTTVEFLGVPYAQPPVGDLRWAPPADATSFAGGALNATAYGSVCPQSAGGDNAGDEDCLFLNVHAPASAGDALPVLVFLHGGGLTLGSGSQFNGSALAARGAVVVTLNYRLGSLGLLALPPQTSDEKNAKNAKNDRGGNDDGDGGVGNFAYLDQVETDDRRSPP